MNSNSETLVDLASKFFCANFNSFFNYSLSAITMLAFILAISSQLGDLFQSWLKRKFNVKDSGFLLPGHGGFFDRLDGLLAAVPVYYGLSFLF